MAGLELIIAFALRADRLQVFPIRTVHVHDAGAVAVSDVDSSVGTNRDGGGPERRGLRLRVARLRPRCPPSLRRHLEPARELREVARSVGGLRPAARLVILANTRERALFEARGWVQRSSGTTSATTITFSVNSNANSLAGGTYGPTTITFTNTTNGLGTTTRTALLGKSCACTDMGE